MKSAIFENFGEPREVLNVVEVEKPKPGPGEVLVKMLMSPVNPSDFNIVRGTYNNALHRVIWNHGKTQLFVNPEETRSGITLPYTPGGDGVGIVESAGSGLMAKRLVGKRVVVIPSRMGNWQEYTVVSAKQALPISKEIPLEQAATFFVNPITSYVITREVFHIPSGAWLLQTAAGSQLGRMIIRLGKRFGFKTINIVRRQEQKEELLQLGADAVISTDRQDIIEEVAKLTNHKGVPYAMDCVGGELGSDLLRCLARNGKLLVYGTLADQPLTFPARDLMTPLASIQGFFLPQWMLQQSLLKKLKIIKSVEKLILKNILQTEIGETFSLDNVVDAMEASEKIGHKGKVLIRLERKE